VAHGAAGRAALLGLEPMRLTHFRQQMADEFGRIRSEMIARDHVFSVFGNRTVDQALDAGYDPKEVWRAVCEAFDVPPERR
jgi:hypothetical protein